MSGEQLEALHVTDSIPSSKRMLNIKIYGKGKKKISCLLWIGATLLEEVIRPFVCLSPLRYLLWTQSSNRSLKTCDENNNESEAFRFLSCLVCVCMIDNGIHNHLCRISL